MKTIVEEASSIIKAIEKGWIKAGKPDTFSIKIYEHPEKNFIGMTTRSAKVGIFFNGEQPAPAHKVEQRPLQPKRAASPKQMPQPTPAEKPTVAKKEREHEFWNQDMLNTSTQWLNTTIKNINNNASFTVEPTGHHLRIVFNQPLLENKDKERQLLRSFSILLLQTLRNKFKRPLRGFKIVLVTADDVSSG